MSAPYVPTITDKTILMKTVTDGKGDSHFFDDDTMRFWDSRVSDIIFNVSAWGPADENADGSVSRIGYFVTSEMVTSWKRTYSVRRFKITSYWNEERGTYEMRSDIETVSELGQYSALSSAKRRAKIEALTESQERGVRA